MWEWSADTIAVHKVTQPRPSATPPAAVAPVSGGPCEDAGGVLPYGAPSCIAAGAQIGVSYPILWYVHCGVWPWISFDGGTFYVSAMYPDDVDQGLGSGSGNFIPGTMTLISPHRALFRDPATNRTVQFQDTMPGSVGVAYSLKLLIFPNFGSLEITFAGRLWTSAAIPSDLRSTAPRTLSGSFTLLTESTAVFVSRSEPPLQFTESHPMCA
jgi:hypothetical protein